MKVFVSSTTKDLEEARKRVCEQLLQLGIQPVSMDWYTADGRPPKQLDHEKVSGSDAFVIIVGHLYGSCPDGEQKSFTEREYEAAVVSGKDVFPFLASDKFPVPPSLREDDATYAKLQAFRKHLGRDHTPRYFDSADHLCAEVAAGVPKPTERAGRIIVPMLPQAYVAHPYAIQENFTGRLKERAMLTEWVLAAESTPMLSLVGMGGLGKSALTWYWLHEDLPHENLRFSGVIWWSYYEREASFGSFLSRALLYASGGTIDPGQVLSDYDRMSELWCILRESPFLIVFDGAERLLRAYHALDAAYRGDAFEEEIGDGHLLCADPRAGQFLQWLRSPSVKTRTILTTRLHPKELECLSGCQKMELKCLDPDDAVQFMRRQGVNGPRNAIVHACEPYDFLPLCLRLLSGAIRGDPERPGDIGVAENWRPPASLKDTQRQHHILQLAYDTMAKDRQDLLSRMAATRGPASYEAAKALSTFEDEQELKEALRELVVRGLLFRQNDKALYDLHPIVRQYAYDRLGNKAAAHAALKNYFATISQPDRIEALDDLMPAIELFHHTVRAGAYNEAFKVYQERLTAPLYFQFGAYDLRISLAKAFFLGGEEKLPHVEGERRQAWLLNGLAIAYHMTGQDHKAIRLLERHNRVCADLRDQKNLAGGLGNLADCQMILGKLKDAEVSLREHIAIAQSVSDGNLVARAHSELARLHACVAEYAKADSELESATSLYGAWHQEQSECVAWLCRAFLELQKGDGHSALLAVEEARQRWQIWSDHANPVERDLVEVLWLSGATKRLSGDAASAEADLDEALSRCRRIRLVECEADILLETAKLQWDKVEGKNSELIDQAKSLTREALEIAERCEYRLKQADIHNFLAELALAEGDKAAALKHAEVAKERAWCDGPPYCYRKALDQAEQMIARLR